MRHGVAGRPGCGRDAAARLPIWRVGVWHRTPGQQPDLCVLTGEDAAVSDARDDTEGLELKVVGAAELPAIRATIAGVPLPAADPLAGASGPVAMLWLER